MLDGAVGVIRRYPRPALGLAAIIAIVSVLVQTLVNATALRPLLELDPVAANDTSSEAFTDALTDPGAALLEAQAAAASLARLDMVVPEDDLAFLRVRRVWPGPADAGAVAPQP